ncbi:hypothetical protein EDB87DRAFT_1360493 [Lactarius vividus]|nr:hypothetical protein EDB87DRAFT_1360493 [Lactarius vividus]
MLPCIRRILENTSYPTRSFLSCSDSVDGTLAVLRRQTNTFEQPCRDGNRELMKRIRSLVHIPHSISAIIGDGVGLARLVRLLLERGANVNAKDKDHKITLLLAMEWKSYEIARVLLRQGADVMNEDGKTPLLYTYC